MDGLIGSLYSIDQELPEIGLLQLTALGQLREHRRQLGFQGNRDVTGRLHEEGQVQHVAVHQGHARDRDEQG